MTSVHLEIPSEVTVGEAVNCRVWGEGSLNTYYHVTVQRLDTYENIYWGSFLGPGSFSWPFTWIPEEPTGTVTIVAWIQDGGEYAEDRKEVTIKPPSPPPPRKGILEVHAYADGQEVAAAVKISGVPDVYTTPFSVELDPGTYTLTATYQNQTQTVTATVAEGEATRVDFQFGGVPPPSPRLPWWVLLAAGVGGALFLWWLTAH